MERKHAMKNLFILTAVIEAGAGLVFFLLPSVAATILFGSRLDAPVAFMVTRLTGAALITLGVACWLARLDLIKGTLFPKTTYSRVQCITASCKHYKLLKNQRSLLFPQRFDLFQVV